MLVDQDRENVPSVHNGLSAERRLTFPGSDIFWKKGYANWSGPAVALVTFKRDKFSS